MLRMEGTEEPKVGEYKEIMNYWNCDGSCSCTSYYSNLELKCPNTACNKSV